MQTRPTRTSDIQPQREHHRKHQHGHTIPTQLLVLEEVANLAAKQIDQQHEVDTRNEHKQGHCIMNGCRIIELQTVVMRRESTSRNRRERVAHSVKHVHTAQPQCHHFTDRQQHIDAPHHLCRIRDARRHFLVSQTRHFGGIQLHSIETEDRKNSYRKHNDSHTAYPLSQRTPKQQTMSYHFQVGNDSRSCSREARHTLKPCIRETTHLTA